MLEEHVMLQFLRKFDEYPFLVKMDGKNISSGKGIPLLPFNSIKRFLFPI